VPTIEAGFYRGKAPVSLYTHASLTGEVSDVDYTAKVRRFRRVYYVNFLFTVNRQSRTALTDPKSGPSRWPEPRIACCGGFTARHGFASFRGPLPEPVSGACFRRLFLALFSAIFCARFARPCSSNECEPKNKREAE
jgi:hypothetical protein